MATSGDPESPFRTLIRELHAKLNEILTAEGRECPTLAFGRVEWNRHVQPPRVVWVHATGRFSPGAAATSMGGPGASLGAIVATPFALIQHHTDEEAYHVIARLWMASARLASANLFDWLHGSYRYPTEDDGKFDKAQTFSLTLPIELPAEREYPGEHPLVQVLGSDLRAGQADSLATDPEATEWQLNRWQ